MRTQAESESRLARRAVAAMVSAALLCGTSAWTNPADAGPVEDSGTGLGSQLLLTSTAFAFQEAVKPEDKKPEDKKPEDKKPEDKKPEDKKPEDKKPEDKKPEDKKPEDKKPEDKKPEDKKPEDKKPEDKKPEDKKPEGKKPEGKKPEEKKPEEKKDELWAAVQAKLTANDKAGALADAEKIVTDPNSKSDMLAGEAVLKELKGKAPESADRIGVIEKIRQLRAIAARPVDPKKADPLAEDDAKLVDTLVLETVISRKTQPQDTAVLKKDLATLAKRVSDRETIASRLNLATKLLDLQPVPQAPESTNPPIKDVTLKNADRRFSLTLQFVRAGTKPRNEQLPPGQTLQVQFEKSIRHFSGDPAAVNQGWVDTPLTGPGTVEFSIKEAGGKAVWIAAFRAPGEPAPKKPEDKKPEDKKPEDKKPEDKKPEDKKPEDKKPEDKKPEDKKPEDKKPEDKKPEDKKPEDKKPEDKKPEDKKPEDKKPEDKKGSALDTGKVTIASGCGVRPEVSMLMRLLAAQPGKPKEDALKAVPRGWEPKLGTAKQYRDRWEQIYPTDKKPDRKALVDIVEYSVALSQKCAEAATEVAPDPAGNDGLERCLHLMTFARNTIQDLMRMSPTPEENMAMQDQLGELDKVKVVYEAVKVAVKEDDEGPPPPPNDLGILQTQIQLLDDRLRASEAKVRKLEGNTEESQYYTPWTKVSDSTYTGKYVYRPYGSRRLYTQTVYYFTTHPGYVYFYSCKDDLYWGRYDLNGFAGSSFFWATTRGSHPNVLTYGNGGLMPRVPHATYSGQRILSPTGPEAAGVASEVAPAPLPPAALPDAPAPAPVPAPPPAA